MLGFDSPLNLWMFIVLILRVIILKEFTLIKGGTIIKELNGSFLILVYLVLMPLMNLKEY